MDTSLEQANGIAGAIQLPLTTDLGILLLVIVSLLAITLWKGNGFVVSLMLALYPTLTLSPRVVEQVPLVNHIPTLGTEALTGQVVVFLALLIVATIAVHRYLNGTEKPEGPWRYVEAALLTIAASGALFSTAYHVVGTHTLLKHSDFIDAWFVSGPVMLAWLAAPIGTLFLVARR